MNVVRDTFWGGRIVVWQPQRGSGYRFNLDPVLLASCVPPGEHIVDLGAGCGIVGLLLLAAGRVRRVTAIERQPEMAALIERNATDNGFADRLQVLAADLRDFCLPRVDRVVFNPPYFARGTGQPCVHPGVDAARHERHGTLADFCAAALRALGGNKEGAIAAIVRAERSAEAVLCLSAGNLSCSLRPVCARPGSIARHSIILAGACRGAERPLVTHCGEAKGFGPEVAPWVDGSIQPAGSKIRGNESGERSPQLGVA